MGGLQILGGNHVDTLRIDNAPPVTYTPDGTNDPSQGTLQVGASVLTFAGFEYVLPVDPAIGGLALSAAEIDEGDVVSLTGDFIDPGSLSTHTVVIDWGDGSASTILNLPVGDRSFQAMHPYRDDNPTGTPWDLNTVTVTVIDNDLLTDTDDLDIRVNNVAPEIAAFASDAVECGNAGEQDLVTVTGAFTDVGILDTHTAVVDWGDGSQTNLAEADLACGVIQASHAYAAGGLYTITITLTDDDTGQDVAETLAIITGVGVLNGQLQIIGTRGDDQVTVNRADGVYRVHADFLPGSYRDVPVGGITSMVMVLCDGDDHATVAGNIDLPTLIDGGDGDDHLNGGRGPNVILGGDGDDRILGGSGQDLLSGGLGSDRIVGNQGDDILIAGSLTGPSGDGDPIVLFDELLDTVIEWDSLRNKAITRPKLFIIGDSAADVRPAPGADWFFYAFYEDIATDRKNHEDREDIG